MTNHGLNITFQGITEEEFFDRGDDRVSVLSGTNNCGKTLVLKQIFERFGESAFLCGANRYYSLEHFPVYTESPGFVQKTWQGTQNRIADERYNHDPVVMQFP